MVPYPSEYTAQQRAAIVAWRLACGEVLRVEDVARIAGVQARAAYRLLCLISHVLPVYDDDGNWQRLETPRHTLGV